MPHRLCWFVLRVVLPKVGKCDICIFYSLHRAGFTDELIEKREHTLVSLVHPPCCHTLANFSTWLSAFCTNRLHVP